MYYIVDEVYINKNRSGRNLLINLYDNPRKLYKYYPLSKEYAVKLADDEKVQTS